MMSDKVAISVNSVSKSFKLPHERHTSIKSSLFNILKGGKRTYEKQEVLKDISFEIKEGEFFGIVGRNGSGKSTLLKMLAGVYSPDKGAISVNGKLTPFIELGVGFNPELTGRENVFLNGALLGFDRKEMEAMYDEIVAFAELERFMDQRLKNYSSGMQVRLAFSIAIRAQSDILLLDEVLAVGDAAFQQKCVDVFEMYKARKQTVILVTHDMESVRKFCTKAALISNGKIVDISSPNIIAKKYEDLNNVGNEAALEVQKSVAVKKHQNPPAKYLSAISYDSNNLPAKTFRTGDKAIFEIYWDRMPIDQVESIGVNVFKLSGEHITGINSRTGNLSKDWLQSRKIQIEFLVNLNPGKYYVEINAFDFGGKIIDALYESPRFAVINPDVSWSGLTELEHTWRELKVAEQRVI